MPFPESYTVALNDNVRPEDHNSHTRDILNLVYALSSNAFAAMESENVRTMTTTVNGVTLIDTVLFDFANRPYKIRSYMNGVLIKTTTVKYDELGNVASIVEI